MLRVEPGTETQIEGNDTPSAFAELGLPQGLCDVVKSLGYELPTPIQTRSIPLLLEGRDLIGQAQTGTGKTAAFALPLLSKVDFALAEPQILVLTPTRELAIQVAEAFQSYARGQHDFHVLPIYGGQAITSQFRQLKRNPQVIVGTPGRVMDHLRRKSLSLSSLKALVIDEADEMLSMGFLEDMEWIITHTPEEKQTVLFSATMPKAIRRVAQTYLKNPEEIAIKPVSAEASLIEQSFWFVNGLHKLDALTRILESCEFDGVLVFVRTKTAAIELSEKLEARGYSAGALNGDMSQDQRERTVDRLKNGRLDILVATDVAARGLHVDRISHVINFDIPFDGETYTHRIGRTGRAGRAGTAILFVSPREQGLLRAIERDTGSRLERFAMPSREDIRRRRVEKFKGQFAEVLAGAELSEQLLVIEELQQEHQVPPEVIAATFCAIIQRETSLLPITPETSEQEGDSREGHAPRQNERHGERQNDRYSDRRPDRRNDRRNDRHFSDRRPDRRNDRHMDRGADRPMDRGGDRPTDRSADRPMDRNAGRPTERQMERGADREMDRQIDRPAGRPTDRPARPKFEKPTGQFSKPFQKDKNKKGGKFGAKDERGGNRFSKKKPNAGAPFRKEKRHGGKRPRPD